MFLRTGSSHTALPDFLPVLPEAMDSARLQMLQELMKEARATGELESSLAATSVMPVPKRPNRKNVPLADFNHAVANMVKPSASVQPPGIQSSGTLSSGNSSCAEKYFACRCACVIKRTANVTGADANASDRCANAF